jgi:hypothetical protein
MQQEKPLLCRIETFSAVKVRYLRCNTIMHECDSFFLVLEKARGMNLQTIHQAE